LLTEQLYDSNIEQIKPGKMDSRERNTVIQESKIGKRRVGIP
jgi:hypothetical protein